MLVWKNLLHGTSKSTKIVIFCFSEEVSDFILGNFSDLFLPRKLLVYI